MGNDRVGPLAIGIGRAAGVREHAREGACSGGADCGGAEVREGLTQQLATTAHDLATVPALVAEVPLARSIELNFIKAVGRTLRPLHRLMNAYQSPTTVSISLPACRYVSDED